MPMTVANLLAIIGLSLVNVQNAKEVEDYSSF
jgi:hypothetical protein